MKPDVIFDGPKAEARAASLLACPTWQALTAGPAAGVDMVLVTDCVAALAPGIYVRDADYVTIGLDPEDPDLAFTLAHELGHHHLHRHLDAAAYQCDQAYRTEIEAEADAYAEELLEQIRRLLAGESDAPDTRTLAVSHPYGSAGREQSRSPRQARFQVPTC